MSTHLTGGFWYEVADEQLALFARMSTRERLEWVDAPRLFTLRTRTPETAQRQERRRRARPLSMKRALPAPPTTDRVEGA